MNNSLPRLIDGMIGTLRAEIIPNLQGDFARGQAFGIIFVLSNIRNRSSWSNEFLGEQLRAQGELAAELSSADLPNAPLPPKLAPLHLPTAAELEEQRDTGDGHVCALIDWLRDQRAALPADRFALAEAAIDRYIRRQLKWELTTSAAPMFDQISRGAD